MGLLTIECSPPPKNSLLQTGFDLKNESNQINVLGQENPTSGTHIGDKEAEHISNGLRFNTSLVWLDLSHNELCSDGPKQFRRALGDNRTLEFLDLSWNHIRRVGAVAICKAIQINKSLVNVNLAWNGLGYEGAIAMEETMKENNVLKGLDISNNRINWEGILHIVRGVRANNTLQMLKIGNNPVSLDGVVELLRAVNRNNSAIIHLGLEDIPVNTKVVELGEEVALKRPFLLMHGGLIESKDMFGIRRERKLDSLMLLIRYLNMSGIRIIDLFRMLDSDSHAKVTKDSFIRGLKKVNAPLTETEMQDVAAKLIRNGGGFISYSLLANGVRNHKREEKKLDMKHELMERKKREERKRILRSDLPLVSSPSMAAVQEMMASMETEFSQQRRSSSTLSRRGSVMSGLLSVTPTQGLPRIQTTPKSSSITRQVTLSSDDNGSFLPSLSIKSRNVSRRSRKKSSVDLFRHLEQ
ncbi:hypothetical protein ScPMuIL_013855 [Solemya velum]